LGKYFESSAKSRLEESSESEASTPDAMTEMEEMKSFITSSLHAQTVELSEKIDYVNQELSALNKKTDGLIDSVEFHSEEIEKLKTDMEDLRKENTALKTDFDKKLLIQEVYSRKINLLVYGIADTEDPETACHTLFAEMGLTRHMDFVNIHRLPRFNTTMERTANAPKPVMVKFLKMTDRQLVYDASFKQRDLLKKRRITIRTDLPVVLKKYRGKLADKGFAMRKVDKVQTRITEKGADVTLQYRRASDRPWITIGLNEELE